MITLIIVDCQNDFITGTMAHKNAKSAVEKIKEFIKNNREKIDKILLTVDWHPYNHSSFKKYGGEYPTHCVQFTPGACIEPKLLKLIQSLTINYEVDTKGEIEEVTEFGAFNDIDYVQDCLGERYYFDSIVTADANTEFVICGVANCVSSTISNLLKEEIVPKVFTEGIISNDNNQIFKNFIKENELIDYESN